jgi:NAD(P)-dependent dehydrogenase (short-subunit alcohol dehydrogenase family)
MSGTCLILGAGPKLGLSLARRFGHAGHPVALSARTPDPLRALVDELAAAGITAAGYPADLGDPADVASVVARARDELGPIEVLVYNAAALGVRATPSTLPVALFEQTMRVNVVGALVAVQLCLSDLDGHGTVLFTGGSYAQRPSAEHCAIGMGKAALRNLTFSLDEELRPRGIHVAMVTITGVIAAGTRFDPDALAEVFLNVHRQPRHLWETEILC